MPNENWSDCTPEERGNAFRAHHRDGMPYPSEINVDEELQQLFPEN